jgi:hypothetical protein
VENFPENLRQFTNSLAMSMDRRIMALLENKLLRIATLLDPRYAFNETIFTKAYWLLIEEQLILYAEKGTF